MRTVAIIQARLGSTRFPRKVLADLHGKSILQHVIERARQIQNIDAVVVACPPDDADTLGLVTDACGVSLWAPECEEADVLTRFCDTMRATDNPSPDAILRITADCVVLDPVVAGQVLALFWDSQPCDFASNDTLVSGYPDGWDVEVFSRAALETAAAQATDPADREHVTAWMKRPENGLRCRTLMAPEPWTGPKLSIDVPSDLEVVKAFLWHTPIMPRCETCGYWIPGEPTGECATIPIGNGKGLPTMHGFGCVYHKEKA